MCSRVGSSMDKQGKSLNFKFLACAISELWAIFWAVEPGVETPCMTRVKITNIILKQ